MSHLSPKSKIIFFIQNVTESIIVPAVIFGVILIIFLFRRTGNKVPLLPVIFWALIFLAIYSFICFILAELKYCFWKYSLEGNSLKVEWGVIFRHSVVIPYDKIQNINIEEPPLYRTFSLAKVLVETAGQTKGIMLPSEGVLPGVEKEVAERIRKFVLIPDKHNEDTKRQF